MNLRDRPVVFVVGVGRSGTTLTELMVASHPEIRFLPEINFVRRFAAERTLQANKEKGIAHLKELLTNDPKLSRLPFSYQDVIDQCFETDNIEQCFLDRVFQKYGTQESQYIGYKDARLIEHAPSLFRTFGGCRIIHIYRDPRDVLASKKNADWSRDHALWRNLASGYIQLRIAAATRQSEFADRFFEIKYEDLLESPESNLKKMCEFLKLEFSTKMLSFQDSASDLVFQDEMQYKKNLFNPLMRKNTGKWKDQLSHYEVALVEKVFAKEMNRFGYPFATGLEPLSFSQKLKLAYEANKIRASYFAYLPSIRKRDAGIEKLR